MCSACLNFDSKLSVLFSCRHASSGDSTQVQELRGQLRRRDDRIDALQQELKVLHMEPVMLIIFLVFAFCFQNPKRL